jgi:hypothetical protein
MITPMRVFVLIFNAGTDNEGIHTVQINDPGATPSGAVRNKILMFESQDDATRFALMLEAQDFVAPTVEGIDSEEIKEFCESAGYDWEIIPEDGNLVLPPEINLEKTDWQPEEQRQDRPTMEMSDSELEGIRRRLEGLL